MDSEIIAKAVDAAAKDFHERHRDKGMFHWEVSSEKWKDEVRALVRPIVKAAYPVIKSGIEGRGGNASRRH